MGYNHFYHFDPSGKFNLSKHLPMAIRLCKNYFYYQNEQDWQVSISQYCHSSNISYFLVLGPDEFKPQVDHEKMTWIRYPSDINTCELQSDKLYAGIIHWCFTLKFDVTNDISQYFQGDLLGKIIHAFSCKHWGNERNYCEEPEEGLWLMSCLEYSDSANPIFQYFDKNKKAITKEMRKKRPVDSDYWHKITLEREVKQLNQSKQEEYRFNIQEHYPSLKKFWNFLVDECKESKWSKEYLPCKIN